MGTEAARGDAAPREALLADGERVHELIRKMRAHLAGELRGIELARWAQAPERAWPAFKKNGTANSVMESLCNLDDAGAMVRRHDIERYLRWLTEGAPPTMHSEPLAVVNLSPEQIASQLSLRETRWWLNGLGWCIDVYFASPFTGRAFMAGTLLYAAKGDEAGVSIADEPSPEALADLFDTLGIDLADALSLHPAVKPEALGRWRLWRQDDNGNRAEIEAFTGLAKARKRLAHFEALHHKQIYWLEGG